MGKLRVINQPLKVSDINFDDLDDEIQSYWGSRGDETGIKRIKHHQRKSFKVEIGS